MLETTETLLENANKKNLQLKAERKKHAKERKDLENEIALLRSEFLEFNRKEYDDNDL